MANLRPPEAPYNAELNVPTANQEEAARAVFQIIQELRAERSAADPDSPGVLTAQEIFAVVLGRVPGAAMTLVEMVNDDQALGDDILEVAHILVNQLGVAG